MLHKIILQVPDSQKGQKKAKFRKTLKNLPRDPSEEAVFKFVAL